MVDDSTKVEYWPKDDVKRKNAKARLAKLDALKDQLLGDGCPA